MVDVKIIEEYKKKLRGYLNEKRFIHSIGVMDTAVKLANIYGCDENAAQVAGLLHDCAKQLDTERMYELCDELGLELDYIYKKTPGLVHQILGAQLIRREFGVDDEAILNAVGCHTTARANMSTLDKVLYLADFIEPSRAPMEGLDALRALCYVDLNKAMAFALELSIKDVLGKMQMLHPDTIAARNEILSEA